MSIFTLTTQFTTFSLFKSYTQFGFFEIWKASKLRLTMCEVALMSLLTLTLALKKYILSIVVDKIQFFYKLIIWHMINQMFSLHQYLYDFFLFDLVFNIYGRIRHHSFYVVLFYLYSYFWNVISRDWSLFKYFQTHHQHYFSYFNEGRNIEIGSRNFLLSRLICYFSMAVFIFQGLSTIFICLIISFSSYSIWSSPVMTYYINIYLFKLISNLIGI